MSYFVQMNREEGSSRQVAGRHPVLEALRSGREVEKVFLQSGTHGEFEKELRGLCREANIPLSLVPKEKLNQMFRGNHQGVLAALSPIEYRDLENLVMEVFESGQAPLLVMLDGVSDVRNIGAIARSAHALGAQGLILSSKKGGQINDEAVKASAGALHYLPVSRVRSLVTASAYLADCGFTLLAADEKAEQDVEEIDGSIPLVVVMGSEGTGIDRHVAAHCRLKTRIPIVGEVGSLNVSVAAGILLYEIRRQRLKELRVKS